MTTKMKNSNYLNSQIISSHVLVIEEFYHKKIDKWEHEARRLAFKRIQERMSDKFYTREVRYVKEDYIKVILDILERRAEEKVHESGLNEE